jgi:hypothetical protein
MLFIDGHGFKTLEQDATEDLVNWTVNQSANATNATLNLTGYGTPNARYTSDFVPLVPNTDLKIVVDPLENGSNFLWCYYLTDQPENGAKVYNPDEPWESSNEITLHVGEAKYLIVLVGNNSGFSAINSWKVSVILIKLIL